MISHIVWLATRHERCGYRRITALLRNDGWRVNHKRVERPSDGRSFRILAVIDECTRECLLLHVARRIRSGDVLDQLCELFITRGMPEYIRSDNGSEFAANVVRKWLNRLDVTTLSIEPGSPWKNGYVESFFGKMRDELLNGEVLDKLDEAKVLVEAWRKVYSKIKTRRLCRRYHDRKYRRLWREAPRSFCPDKKQLHLLTSVLKEPKIKLNGSDDELERLVKRI